MGGGGGAKVGGWEWLDVNRKWLAVKERRELLNQLFGLEVSSQIKNLPRGQSKQTTHGEDAEVHHS